MGYIGLNLMELFSAAFLFCQMQRNTGICFSRVQMNKILEYIKVSFLGVIVEYEVNYHEVVWFEPQVNALHCIILPVLGRKFV